MSMTRAFYYLALPSQHHKIVHPLLRILAVSPEVERVVLTYILSISHAAPVRLWYNFFRDYLIIAKLVALVLLTLYPIHCSRR
jgi:AP-3 complex subunit beta